MKNDSSQKKQIQQITFLAILRTTPPKYTRKYQDVQY